MRFEILTVINGYGKKVYRLEIYKLATIPNELVYHKLLKTKRDAVAKINNYLKKY